MSTTAMTAITDSSSAQAKKPYARQMTDKRREQNRRSQKVYREKLKKKLEELEDYVQDKSQTKQRSSPPEATVRDVESSSPVASVSSDIPSNIIDLNLAFAAGGDLALPTDTTLPTFQLGIRSRDQCDTPSTSNSPAELVSPDDASIPKFLAVDVYAPTHPGALDMRNIWPIPVSSYWENYTPPTLKERYIPPNTTTLTARSTPSLGWSPFSRTPSSVSTPSGIPSPYLNHLQLLGEAAFNATLAVAAAVRIPKSAYLNDHPSPFSPTPDNPVPPYNYKAIPKDLRPTPVQQTVMHPSYLDCIVFAKFRSNAIILSSRGELDHCSLFLDLMHDGLVCWGNENASKAAGRDMRDGVAWSKRSWEARPWFLRKWGWLLAIDPHEHGVGLTQGGGGVVVDEDEHDDDGMFEGSRWWRNMRGEVTEEEARGEEHGELLSRHRTCNIGLRDHKVFAELGTLWPTQYADPMAMTLEAAGLSASYAMQLGQE